MEVRVESMDKVGGCSFCNSHPMALAQNKPSPYEHVIHMTSGSNSVRMCPECASNVKKKLKKQCKQLKQKEEEHATRCYGTD